MRTAAVFVLAIGATLALIKMEPKAPERQEERSSISQIRAHCSSEETVQRRLEKGLRDLIETEAGNYFNPQWEITLSQYKGWLAMIPMMEAGCFGSSAHSNQLLGKETFYHCYAGWKFPFSTSTGDFQLHRGGESGDENWQRMSTLDKLNPQKSLLSAMKWHRNRFPAGATLSKFQKLSPWMAVKDATADFQSCWKSITKTEWDECKMQKMKVAFDPLVMDDVKTVEYLGQKEWRIYGEKGMMDTWLVHAKTYHHGKTYTFDYYYTLNPENGLEVWAWADDTRMGYFRIFGQSHLPERIRKAKYAGFVNEVSMLQ